MKKNNRWILTEEVEEKYFDKVVNFLKNPQKYGGVLDLSDTELNPATLTCMLEHFEYEEMEKETNGWEMDFEITLCNVENDEYETTVVIQGCGLTFELKLVCE